MMVPSTDAVVRDPQRDFRIATDLIASLAIESSDEILGIERIDNHQIAESSDESLGFMKRDSLMKGGNTDRTHMGTCIR